MGKITCNTGATVIGVSVWDRIIIIILVAAGIEAAIFYADYWFFGGHRTNLVFFIILSYAIFRGVIRSMASWVFFLFVKIPALPIVIQTKEPVDILTTAMPGEPFEMFDITLKAIAAITWPHTTYLLDGGNDAKLMALCKETGAAHVDCRGVKGAKGGKINHCLATVAQSPFVLVLDPDHIPKPDFLDRVVPLLTADKKLAFVQVVQAYYNFDKNVVAHAAAEQTFGFYGPLQIGLEGLGMPIAIGANCTFRRKALDSIGGHAVHLAEDACTSLRLHAAGWKSRYLPYRASEGLVPEDLNAFYKQQIKWARGLFDLFTGEFRRLFFKLNGWQRFYYFFAGTFYLTGAVTCLTLLLPPILLFFQIYAIEMPLSEFLIHARPYIGVSYLISVFIQRWYSDKREHGFPWRSMFLEKGTWHIYTLAFFYTLINKEVVWLPTSKAGAAGATGAARTSPMLVAPHLVMIFLNIAGVVFALTTYHRIDHGTVLMMFFAALNVLSLIPCTLWGLVPARMRRNA